MYLSISNVVELIEFTFKPSNYHQNAKTWEILYLESVGGISPTTYKRGRVISVGLRASERIYFLARTHSKC